MEKSEGQQGEQNDEAGSGSPHLDEQQQGQAADNASLSPIVIHEIIREDGETEIERSGISLAWSGLAAGLSIGFSFVVQAYLQAGLGDVPWHRLVDTLGYSVGFLIVILGRQQLFTETTLTALIPTLTNRTWAGLRSTSRVWGIVLAANLVGTVLFGIAIAQPWLLSPEAQHAMVEISEHVVANGFAHTLASGAFAGWLIGLMVWLLPGAGPARPLIIIILTYVVALCQFPHVISCSAEAAFAVASGHITIADAILHFFLPTLIGNSLGGTALAALLNHAPIAAELGNAGAKPRNG